MIEKTTENQFSTVVYGELGDLFRSQNWRIREQKEGRSSRKLLTKEEVWKTALGLASEDQLDQLLAEVATDTATHGQITFLLAKCMFYDGSAWEDAIKNFWFSPESLEPFKKQALTELKSLKKHDEDRQAIKLLEEHLPVKILDGDEGADMEFSYPSGKGDDTTYMPCTTEVPRRLINIANLLENTEYQRKSDKNYRNTVTYRMRTDCNEIIKLAATACNMSATEFVEALALETSQLMVRSKLKQFEKAAEGFKPTTSDSELPEGFDAAFNEFFGKLLYTKLEMRYSKGETNAFFPLSRHVKPKKGVHHTNGAKWVPYDDVEKTLKHPEGMTRQEAVKWATRLVTDAAERAQMWLERQNVALEVLETIVNAGEDNDFTKICNDFWENSLQPMRSKDKAEADSAEPVAS